MNEVSPITKNKKSRRSVKQWAKDNEFALTMVVFYGTAFGVLGWLMRETAKDVDRVNAEIDAYNARITERNKLVNDRQNAGDDVYYLADERILTIDKDGNKQTHIL